MIVCCAKAGREGPVFLFFVSGKGAAGIRLAPLRPVATLRSNAKAPLSSCQPGAASGLSFFKVLSPYVKPRSPRPGLSNQHVSDIFPHVLISFSSFYCACPPRPPAAFANRHEHGPEGNLLLSERGERSSCPSIHPSVCAYEQSF